MKADHNIRINKGSERNIAYTEERESKDDI